MIFRLLKRYPSFSTSLRLFSSSKMPKVAAIQMTSTPNVQENMQKAAELIASAASAGAQLVVLPEMFAVFGERQDKLLFQEPFGEGPIQAFLSEQSRQNSVWLVGGTIPISTNDPSLVRASCLVTDNEGRVVARYDKIHLFDVVVEEKKEEYKESATTEAGSEIVLLDSPIGKLGLAVCYDLRFPELFRLMAQRGAEVFLLPAAFTQKTGEAHWHLLCRARAVDNFCYLVGSAQGGNHNNKRTTYGHSMIVDPWGTILDEVQQTEGFAMADIDLEQIRSIRKRVPVLSHQKVMFDLSNLTVKSPFD
eukprot:TRINITY_DN2224_c0_g3_i1.p1 TRINITY_DN2224_c0_g3~~TRINITY_DN2224_c0_g3_i1.p1  ORF type:complete len:306 (+),score=31.16 TRINITY_DN2224_c0_g3_i1:360-1277(+)